MVRRSRSDQRRAIHEAGGRAFWDLTLRRVHKLEKVIDPHTERARDRQRNAKRNIRFTPAHDGRQVSLRDPALRRQLPLRDAQFFKLLMIRADFQTNYFHTLPPFR